MCVDVLCQNPLWRPRPSRPPRVIRALPTASPHTAAPLKVATKHQYGVSTTGGKISTREFRTYKEFYPNGGEVDSVIGLVV